MGTVRMTFTRHVFRQTAKYVCTVCGKKWQRSANTEWTENPFNKEWMAGQTSKLDKKCVSELKKKLVVCPCPECLAPNAPKTLGGVSAGKV